MKTNQNSPAMPTVVGHEEGKIVEHFQNGNTTGVYMGLSKREYFAAIALQGILPNYFDPRLQKQSEMVGASIDTAMATIAVCIADAFISELNKSE